MIQRVVVGKREILLGDDEDVQGEPALQGNHELIHVGEPGQQHKRDEGQPPFSDKGEEQRQGYASALPSHFQVILKHAFAFLPSQPSPRTVAALLGWESTQKMLQSSEQDVHTTETEEQTTHSRQGHKKVQQRH